MAFLLDDVKSNLVIEHNEDDFLLQTYIATAVSYAEGYQHLEDKYYLENPMTPATRQAVIMLASHLYESRDGSTGGFFNDSVAASQQAWNTINRLLLLGREWKV